jgi:hypothetical protein
MKIQGLFFIFCLIILNGIPLEHATAIASPTSNHVRISPEAQYKAAIILKFASITEWPVDSPISDLNSPFVIGVIGERPIYSLLTESTKNMKIRQKKVKIIAISDYSQIKNCNALFISTVSRRDFEKIIKEVEQRPILTISDTIGYEKKGVMINLFFIRGKCRFNVNCIRAEECGIMLTSKIVGHAENIIR